MKAKLSRTARRAVDQRHDILELLKRLTPELIEDLDRRARFLAVPDGYPRGGGGGIHGSDVSRPTEASVIARDELEVLPADPIGEQIALVLATLSEAAGVLKPVDRWLRYLAAYQDQAIVRDTTGASDCRGCDRTVAGGAADPIRSGLCNACRSAYVRWSDGHPVSDDPAAHRLEFERWRHEQLAERADQAAGPAPAPVVCGHRCCSRVHEHEHFHGPAECPDCGALDSGAAVAS